MKIYFENAKKLLFIINNKKSNLFILIFVFLTASLLELVSLGIIYPYVNLVIDSELAIASKPLSYLSPFVENQEFKNYFGIASIILILIFLLKTFMSIFIKWFITRFSERHLSNLLVRLMCANIL